MSVVAAKIEDGIINIASDSYCTIGDGNICRYDSKKIFRFNNTPIVVGSVGAFRDKNEFPEFLSGKNPIRHRSDLFELMRDFREWKVENHFNDQGNSSFLIATKIGMFVYSGGNSELSEYDDYVAIGAGYQIATTAMYLGQDPVDAVMASCELSHYCGGTVQSDKVELYDESKQERNR